MWSGVARLRQGDGAELQGVTDAQLRHAHAVLPGDCRHALVVEDLAVSDRRVRLDEDVVVPAVGDQFSGCVAGVHQDLVDVRGDSAVFEDVFEVLLEEVGHPDGAHLAGLEGIFECLPRGQVAG